MNALMNNSINSINFDDRLFAKFLINICALLSVSFAIIVSLCIIIYIVIIYNTKRDSKTSFNVFLLLTDNTCLAIICSSFILTLIHLSNLGGDRNIYALKSIIFWGCHLRGYLLSVFLDSVYMSYVLQAGYRLLRVVFHKYKSLRAMSTFVYFILLQWIISFLLMIPLLFMGKNNSASIVYLPEDLYCQTPMTNIPALIYSLLVLYLLPLCCICMKYFCIIIYIRRYSRQSASTLKLRRQNKRDTIVIKRICIVTIILLISGIPSLLFVIIFFFTGNLHWAFYRVAWMTMSVSYSFISFSSVYVTPEIYKPIRNIFGRPKRNYRNFSSNKNIIRTPEQSETLHLRSIVKADTTISI
jgi:hypothetical protein